MKTVGYGIIILVMILVLVAIWVAGLSPSAALVLSASTIVTGGYAVLSWGYW